MTEENKDTVKVDISSTHEQSVLGTKINCKCSKSDKGIAIWLVVLALVINNCTGFLPSAREHRMEQDIALHETDIKKLYNLSHRAQDDIKQLEGYQLSNEATLIQVKSKVNIMDKSLTELVNQHKRKK